MQSGYQTLALDIMQRMTLLQEAALERLYRWTQNQCKHIENERLAPLLVKAMNKLQDRPVLFKYVFKLQEAQQNLFPKHLIFTRFSII